MRITDIACKRMTFTLHEPVHVAFGVITGFDTLIIKVETDEGITGYGEAGPLEYVTGESIETCEVVGALLKEKLLGMDPIAIAEIHKVMDQTIAGNTSIKAAYDIAMYDIAAKRMGVPLYKYLGGTDPVLTSDVTISMNPVEKMVEDCLKWKDRGFNILKIKLGEDAESDLARMTAIRKAVGEEITLRVDANQGWNVKDSIWIEEQFRKLHIELIEQPVRDSDYEGMARITAASQIPIAADESCHTSEDALKLIRGTACDAINIKLMKCGGIYDALKINAISEAAHQYCMIGCMGESLIANTAAMHLAAARRNIRKIDLDVTFLADCDSVVGGFCHEGGKCILSDEPGIGVKVLDF